MSSSFPPGTTPIKPEYIISRAPRAAADDDAAEGATNHAVAVPIAGPAAGEPGAATADVRDGGGAQRTARGGKRGRKDKGANKGRRWAKVHDELNLCWRVAAGRACEFGAECRFTHDVPVYLAQKPHDIHFPPVSALSSDPPFVHLPDPPTPAPEGGDAAARPIDASLDAATICPVFAETGACRHGLKCRFLGAHARVADGTVELIEHGDHAAAATLGAAELNFAGAETLTLLRKRKFATPVATAYLAELKAQEQAGSKPANAPEAPADTAAPPLETAPSIVMFSEPDADPAQPFEPNPPAPTAASAMPSSASASTVTAGDALMDTDAAVAVPTEAPAAPDTAALSAPPLDFARGAVDETDDVSTSTTAPAGDAPMDTVAAIPAEVAPAPDTAGLSAPPADIARGAVDEGAGLAVQQADTPDVPMRFAEKKSLRWEGLTYLAPLTTVGNLPFRRLCVSLGADITCGEMSLATSLLQGSKEEWSLVRRHPSERTFGVQIAGAKPATLVPAAEALARVCGDGGVDFVDLNCGCPIDLVVRTGSGSALLDAVGRLSKSLLGMSRALGTVPLTVKLRTGIKDGHNNAHKLMPRARLWGVSAMTLHGRTRQQRYSKLADWEYIGKCVEAVRAAEADEDLPRIPIFGGGDAFSAADYWSKVDASGADGVMLARGALIKPWLFTEVKERREWDISARERLELIRRYAEYGLSHFGSDTAGVNTTRRYLCEALSFQYRYVPIGLLEVLPGRINDRPPAFRGRDELETLLASDDSRDWVRISEMFLGRAPESWSFVPKHKSNAYESQG